jgi:hypothetical protein
MTHLVPPTWPDPQFLEGVGAMAQRSSVPGLPGHPEEGEFRRAGLDATRCRRSIRQAGMMITLAAAAGVLVNPALGSGAAPSATSGTTAAVVTDARGAWLALPGLSRSGSSRPASSRSGASRAGSLPPGSFGRLGSAAAPALHPAPSAVTRTQPPALPRPAPQVPAVLIPGYGAAHDLVTRWGAPDRILVGHDRPLTAGTPDTAAWPPGGTAARPQIDFGPASVSAAALAHSASAVGRTTPVTTASTAADRRAAYDRSLVYAGLAGLAVAGTGLALVGSRRRLW